MTENPCPQCGAGESYRDEDDKIRCSHCDEVLGHRTEMIAEYVGDLLDHTPAVDTATRDKVVERLINDLEYHRDDDVPLGEVLNWGLEDFGVPREDRMTVRQETVDRFGED